MRSATLPHTLDLAPMGVTARIDADDARLLDAVRAGYGAWEAVGSGDRPAIRLRLESGRRPGGERPPAIRVAGSRLRLEAPGIEGEADARTGEARCTVPRALLGDRARLLAEVVDPLLLFLLTRAGRVPVHAAGVMVGETVAVLAGPSGAGKSTLALAALRAGLGILSDDTLYVQLEPRLCVWGLPRPLHFLPGTPLSERDGGAVPAWRGGRRKLALTTSRGWAPGLAAGRAILCLLERGERAALLPLDPEAAVARMVELLEPGFDHFRARVPDVARALATGGAFRLVLTPRPEEGIAVLRGVGR